MTDGLLRQRRNLIIACVLLWTMKYGGITISKILLAGFEVHLQRPEAIIQAIWIAFAYFLYRYYQYFSSEGVSKLKEVVAQKLNERCEPIIKRRVKSAHPYNNDAVLYAYDVLKTNRWIYHGQDHIPDDDGKIYRTTTFDFEITRISLAVPMAKAISDSLFRNSVATDYIFPFALAAFVLFYCGQADWQGSFLNFIWP